MSGLLLFGPVLATIHNNIYMLYLAVDTPAGHFRTSRILPGETWNHDQVRPSLPTGKADDELCVCYPILNFH